MASAREMHAISGDPVKVRNLALGLLAMRKVAENLFNEWELTFLHDTVEQAEKVIALSPKERKEYKFSEKHAEARLALREFRLTSRQAEKLFEIRDSVTLYGDIGGISVRNLIVRCYGARGCGLIESDDEYIEGLWKSGVTKLRLPDLIRLKRCSIEIGELEPYM